MAFFLDSTGLSHFWSIIKDKFVQAETGKGLSTNDFTTDEKTKLEGFSAASNYALKTDLTGFFKFRGSVAYRSVLNNEEVIGSKKVGDVYDVEDTGMNYVWNGSAWDALGGASGEGLKLTLLWENASPKSSFAAQTITFSQDYEWYLVDWVYSSSSTRHFNNIIHDGWYSNMVINSSNTDGDNATRGYYFSGASIVISAASYNGSTSNAYSIPFAIYGISGVTTI